MKGVLVLDVLPGSAAEKCGLRPTKRDARGKVIFGDVITAVDDQTVDDNSRLLEILDKHKVGETINVTVQRDDQKVELKAVLQEID